MTVITISDICYNQIILTTTDSLIITSTGSIDTTGVAQPNVFVDNLSTSVTILNNGSLVTSNDNIIIASPATVTSLTNNKIISSGSICIYCNSNSTINTLNNSGLINSSSNNGIYCNPNSTINTLNNFGTITSTNKNILSDGTIGTLNNLQSGLTYNGYLPTNYNIVIYSLSLYGQLFYDIAGPSTPNMNFNIHSTSILSSGTYTNVITGLNQTTVTNTSGTFGNFNWKLVFNNGGTKTFDLIVTLSGSNAQTAACTSQPGGPQPPRLWSRGTLSCIPLTATITQRDLDMRRKAEILKYKANSAQLTKKQKWSQMVRGNGPLAKTVWANQNILGSNPNVDNLPLGPGNTLICNSEPIRCSLSTSCDVPGPAVILCDDPNVPLVNYIVQRTYLAGGTKFPQTCWQPGDDGFPVGKAGSDTNQ